jgi:hypothetical protein
MVYTKVVRLLKSVVYMFALHLPACLVLVWLLIDAYWGIIPLPLLVHNSKASIKQASKTRSLRCYYCCYCCYDSTTARHARTHHPKTADSHTHRPTQSRGRPILQIRQRPQAQAAKTRSAPTHVLALQRGRVLSGYTTQYTAIVKYCTLVHTTYKHSVQKHASTAAISITYYHCHH